MACFPLNFHLIISVCPSMEPRDMKLPTSMEATELSTLLSGIFQFRKALPYLATPSTYLAPTYYLPRMNIQHMLSSHDIFHQTYLPRETADVSFFLFFPLFVLVLVFFYFFPLVITFSFFSPFHPSLSEFSSSSSSSSAYSTLNLSNTQKRRKDDAFFFPTILEILSR
ncbi:hypothetical protein L249_2011 [Ophiocordyceps polyrhachis-furcata BCC 54312]|uniref:Uncharacterized protein n=1 Tax=Ophiocordyceps polyrhachis-furcata BCC 54312 TaxID=1330021 RepID=A0A367LQT9_9HYPO|nr:hypothetical protein L249_2011 [Ophiocordyceps polyrhachis-furcata BCC 54312]